MAGQHAVAGLSQIAALGLTPRAVQKRAGDDRLYRIHRGVYSLVPPELLSWRGRYLAAVLACGDRAVLSHRSAGDLLGLRPTVTAAIDVTVAGRTTRRPAGITVHRSITLIPADLADVDGIPCTSVARTLFDLCGSVSAHQRERALNQAEVRGVLDVAALDDLLRRHPRHSAAAGLRRALELYRPGDAPAESALEERFIALCRRAGLPAPQRQVWFTLEDGGEPFRADFVWRAQRLVLETDGRGAHLTRQAFEADRRRDQRLIRAGWRVVRVTWRQVRDDPGSVVALVADLLGA